MAPIVDFLLTTPIVLFPILVILAVAVFALIKRLLKMAAVLVIAGVLYALLVEYFGQGM
jgi:hypothetical protein